MSQKLLQPKKRRIAPVKGSVAEPRKVVLVGTYAENQLEAWPGYYPYPLAAQDEVDADACKAVNEIWLFKGASNARTEGFNNKIRWLIRQAYGCRDFRYFRLKIFDLPNLKPRDNDS